MLERFEKRGVGDFPNLYVVRLVEVSLGSGDAGGPRGVVGEKQQALAGFVQPADGCDPGSVRAEERVNRVASLFIRSCRDDTARLVHREINLGSSGEGLVVDFDAVFADVDGRFWVAAKRAVHANFARSNEFDSLGAGAISELR